MATADRVFVALANPVRRELPELRTARPLAGELGDRFEVSRPAVAEHPKVLRDAGLVADEPRGYTFAAAWTLTWRLAGSRVSLEHNGFDLNDKRTAEAVDRMGPGWSDVVLPRLADAAARA